MDTLGGVAPRRKWWTADEIALVTAAYDNATVGRQLDLDALSALLGRHKTNISRKARQLGLTNIARPKTGERKDRRKYKGDRVAQLAAQSTSLKQRIATNGHPRGMLGKKHKAEVLARIAETSRERWAAMTEFERLQQTDKMVRSRLEKGTLRPPQVARGVWKAGWREIGSKRHYFRSRWEANYARWLQWLKERGEIIEWEYEPTTFWFEKIKRGVRSYKPDFRVEELNGDKNLHEVKGWMDARSKTTLKRMAKYFPDEIIILIREKQIRSLARFSALIGDWE